MLKDKNTKRITIETFNFSWKAIRIRKIFEFALRILGLGKSLDLGLGVGSFDDPVLYRHLPKRYIYTTFKEGGEEFSPISNTSEVRLETP